MPIEAAPSKHAIAQGFFLYGLEPGGNRIEVTTGGYFVFDPEHEPVVWTRGRAPQGPGLGRQDGRELPHLRDAARARAGVSHEATARTSSGSPRRRESARSRVGPIEPTGMSSRAESCS